MDGARAENVADEVRANGGEAMAILASVTDEAQVAAMVDRTMSAWGRVDILLNNAGVLRDKSFAKMALADFRLVLDVHLMGSVIPTKAVWEIMREQRYGRVVMTTSSSGLFGNFGQANYSAAKMALVGLMQTLALEGAKYDIKVNCLAPTAATPMTEGFFSPEATTGCCAGAGQPRPSGAGRRGRADARHPVRRRRAFRAGERDADARRGRRRRQRGCRAGGLVLGGDRRPHGRHGSGQWFWPGRA